MSDIVCAQCGHGPHTAKPCHTFGCSCPRFVRFEVAAAQLLVNLNNNVTSALQHTNQLLSTVVDVMAELHPDIIKVLEDRFRQRVETERAAQEAAAQDAQESVQEEATNDPQ